MVQIWPCELVSKVLGRKKCKFTGCSHVNHYTKVVLGYNLLLNKGVVRPCNQGVFFQIVTVLNLRLTPVAKFLVPHWGI
jgi:hypothetical protein